MAVVFYNGRILFKHTGDKIAFDLSCCCDGSGSGSGSGSGGSGSGSGGGGGIVTVCCPLGVPAVLFGTISNTAGDAVDLPGNVTLTHDGGVHWNSELGSMELPCEGFSCYISLDCQLGGCDEIGGDYAWTLEAVASCQDFCYEASSPICEPLELTFTGVDTTSTGGCSGGSYDIVITE